MAMQPNYNKSYYFDGSKILSVSMAHNLGAIVAWVPFFTKKVILFKADPELYEALGEKERRDLLKGELQNVIATLN
jgi:hypothetical protein